METNLTAQIEALKEERIAKAKEWKAIQENNDTLEEANRLLPAQIEEILFLREEIAKQNESIAKEVERGEALAVEREELLKLLEPEDEKSNEDTEFVYLSFEDFRSHIESDLDPVVNHNNKDCSGWLSQLYGMWKTHLSEFDYVANSIYSSPVKSDNSTTLCDSSCPF